MKTDNELIAEFMGFSATETHNIHGVVYSHPELSGVYGDKAQRFKYDTSWDWLMPVVEKIRGLYVESTHDRYWTMAIDKLHAVILYAKIDNVREAVVEFIHWYNAQPKQ